MRNPIVTLLTDFGTKDYFVASMKGVILNINPRCCLIDISHDVFPQDIREGAFILANAFSYFPKGTIHLAVVDPGVGSERKPILIETKNYFFLGPDNGLLTLATKQDEVRRVIKLTNKKYFLPYISSTFHGRDIFSPVAGYLSLGLRPETFGEEIKDWVKLDYKEPNIKGDKLFGEIIHIDHFGNLITNINRERFIYFTKSYNFNIKIKGKKVSGIKSGYWEGEKGEIIALFGSCGMLELSIKNESAQNKLKVKIGDPIIVERDIL
jgi:S-adenosylmethionine hydrolase